METTKGEIIYMAGKRFRLLYPESHNLKEKRVRVFAGRSEKRKDLRIPPRRQLLGYRKP